MLFSFHINDLRLNEKWSESFRNKTQTYVSGTNYLKIAILLSLNYFKLLFQCPIKGNY